jgi:hypothetical protein
MRLQAGTPEHLRELGPRLRLKPFGLYVRADKDPAFGAGGSVLGLDPGTDLADWESLGWHDEQGKPVSVTTEPGELGNSVLATLSAKARRWMKAQSPRSRPPVQVVAVRRAGRAGPAIDARALDPDADLDAYRVFYDDESAASLQRLALDVGPGQFARMTGVSPRAARRLARTGKPTRSMVRRALGAIVAAPSGPRTCRCGRALRRENAQACSAACRQRAYRERHKAQA